VLWPEGHDHGYLHFIDPDGNKQVVWVTEGETTQTPAGRNVWHIQVNGDLAIVSPSIHYVGVFHTPNPVHFQLVEDL
jgi:hypothetical protein